MANRDGALVVGNKRDKLAIRFGDNDAYVIATKMLHRIPHPIEHGSKRLAYCQACKLPQYRQYLPGTCIACNGKLVRMLLSAKRIKVLCRPVGRTKSEPAAMANSSPVSNYRRIWVADNIGSSR